MSKAANVKWMDVGPSVAMGTRGIHITGDAEDGRPFAVFITVEEVVLADKDAMNAFVQGVADEAAALFDASTAKEGEA